jgi:hypothetical protein
LSLGRRNISAAFTTLGNGSLASSVTLCGTNANALFIDSAGKNALGLGAIAAKATLMLQNSTRPFARICGPRGVLGQDFIKAWKCRRGQPGFVTASPHGRLPSEISPNAATPGRASRDP